MHELITAAIIGFIVGCVAGGFAVNFILHKIGAATNVDATLHAKVDQLGQTVINSANQLAQHVTTQVAGATTAICRVRKARHAHAMTASNFPACLAIILKEEGGNDDDPNDHGGRTSRGITQREYDVYRQSHADLPSDVWQAPQTAVDDIYKTQYWNPYCDNLPSGVDLVFFNASVNSGRLQAAKELQRALGIPADGMVGMVTMQAVDSCKDIPGLIHKDCDQRRAFYKALAQFPRYGKGWLARTDRVETAAIQMAPVAATDDPPANPDPTVTDSPKAIPSDASEATVSVTTASGGSGAATVGAAVTDQLQTLSTSIQPLSETFHWVKIGCLVIAVICAGLTIWAVIKHKQAKAVT